MKRWAMPLVKAGGTAVLLYVVLRGIDWSRLTETLSQAEALWLPLTFIFFLGRIAILAYRWRLLLSDQGLEVSYGSSLAAYLIASFFNIVTPANIGGDLYRMQMARGQKGFLQPGVSVLLEKLLGFASLLALMAIGIWLYRGLAPVSLVARVILVVCVAGVVGWVMLSLGTKLSPFLRAHRNRLFANRTLGLLPLAPGTLAATIFLSLLAHMLVVGANYFVLRALSLEGQVPADFLLFAVPAATFCAMLPISYLGIGVNENLFGLFFSSFAVPIEVSVAFSWLGLLASRIAVAVLGAFVFVARAQGTPGTMKSPKGQSTSVQ